MTKNKHLIWIGLGTIAAFLMGLLAIVATQAIIWGPALIEIVSVTWNDAPTL